MTQYIQFANETGHVGITAGVQSLLKVAAVDTVQASQALRVGYGHLMQEAVTTSASALYKWTAGAAINDLVKVSLTQLPAVHIGVTMNDLVTMGTHQNWAISTALYENLSAHSVALAAIGSFIREKVKAFDAPVPAAVYHLLVAQAVQVHDAYASFAAVGITENVVTHASVAASAALAAYLQDVVRTQDYNHDLSYLVFNITASEGVEIEDANVLKAIFAPSMAETIAAKVLYLSPSGSLATWAINTRTNAITEYQNWAFTSFAAMGRKYIAAASDGLYELDGARDGVTNIEATIQSGLMQLNAGKLAGLKAAYLGLRGQGGYLLKLAMGDGREYVYQVKSQPGLMTTKVNIGKGLRSRYMAFELVSTGLDFDLDTIEFIPMVSDRRV